MSECLVGVSHLVSILTLLAGAADAVHSVKYLSCESFLHGLFVSLTRIPCEPSKTQSLPSFGADIHRHLIGSSADTAGLDLEIRHYIFHCLLECLESGLARLALDDFKCTVYNLLGYSLLTVNHDIVDKTGNQLGIVDRILQNITLCNVTSSWHLNSLLHKMIS